MEDWLVLGLVETTAQCCQAKDRPVKISLYSVVEPRELELTSSIVRKNRLHSCSVHNEACHGHDATSTESEIPIDPRAAIFGHCAPTNR